LVPIHGHYSSRDTGGKIGSGEPERNRSVVRICDQSHHAGHSSPLHEDHINGVVLTKLSVQPPKCSSDNRVRDSSVGKVDAIWLRVWEGDESSPTWNRSSLVSC